MLNEHEYLALQKPIPLNLIFLHDYYCISDAPFSDILSKIWMTLIYNLDDQTVYLFQLSRYIIKSYHTLWWNWYDFTHCNIASFNSSNNEIFDNKAWIFRIRLNNINQHDIEYINRLYDITDEIDNITKQVKPISLKFKLQYKGM